MTFQDTRFGHFLVCLLGANRARDVPVFEKTLGFWTGRQRTCYPKTKGRRERVGETTQAPRLVTIRSPLTFGRRPRQIDGMAEMTHS